MARTRDIVPTAERIAKGDVELYTPRDYNTGGVKRDLPPVYRSRQAPETLWTLHHRGSIDVDQLRAGRALGAACEAATREHGAINLESTGGPWSGGLTYARCAAMDALSAMWAALPEIGRPAIWAVLVGVCHHRLTLREMYPGSSARARASDMLGLGLRRIAAGAM